MPLYRVTDESFERVPETTFAHERFQERQDIQRLIRADITVLGPDLMVVAEEFCEWEDSNRRIDLLCLDRQARIVVVELKRTDDGGHMELQAIRYAAMVSGMTLNQLATAHARYRGVDHPQAEAALLHFLDWDSDASGALSKDVRIVLASGNYSREITTAVMWLNDQGLDITCYRMKPHRVGEELLVDIEQIIPIPEASDYTTKLKTQRQEEQRVASAKRDVFNRFWTTLIQRSRGKTTVVANRSTSSSRWLSGSIGRTGFSMNFVLNQHESVVECYITFGRDKVDEALQAFNALRAQSEAIEQDFGEPLRWDDLPGKQACRISSRVDGGWKTPEDEWPEFQHRLIEAMARLEQALRGPIAAIRLE